MEQVHFNPGGDRPRELDDLSKEVDQDRRQVSEREDRLLEVFEQVEAAQAAADQATAVHAKTEEMRSTRARVRLIAGRAFPASDRANRLGFGGGGFAFGGGRTFPGFDGAVDVVGEAFHDLRSGNVDSQSLRQSRVPNPITLQGLQAMLLHKTFQRVEELFVKPAKTFKSMA